MKKNTSPKYLKVKKYRHITNNVIENNVLDVHVFSYKFMNTNYISKYNFFPLLKYIKKENKYKKSTNSELEKQGKNVILCNSKTQPIRKNKIKERPIEYPTHKDAMIYGFYAQELLSPAYEHLLKQNTKLNESVIGYRKIPINEGDNINKSTIHFAKEVFDYIQKLGECNVLTFDIKNFFPSLNHKYLREALISVLFDYSQNKSNEKEYSKLNKKYSDWGVFDKNSHKLPSDLHKIFNAIIKYSYIELNDLKRKDGKKGFDEQRLEKIRQKGVDAFFHNPEEMREYIFKNQITIYKNGKKGIPHGLPISAYLANIYMKLFDENIINALNKIDENCLYRRYSDDMIVVFPNKDNYIEEIKSLFETEIKQSSLVISKQKTELFFIRKENELLFSNKDLLFIRNDNILKEKRHKYPITYLGLEFHGEKLDNNEKRLDIRIKNSSIIKFYRRMDMAIKKQIKLAFKYQEKELTEKPLVFRRKLYKLFSLNGANKKYRETPQGQPKDKPIYKNFKKLVYNQQTQKFNYETQKFDTQLKHLGNAITFAKRCDYIFFGAKIVTLKTGEIKKMPIRVMYKQYRHANKLLEKRIAYWIDRYNRLYNLIPTTPHRAE